MSTFETRITSMVVLPEGTEMFSEMATTISITDEAGGEFVEVAQHGRSDLGKVQIQPDEWPHIRAAIDRMIGECRETRQTA